MPLDREELGRRLKKAREAAGLTQEDVADQLGISRGALAQFETGTKAPNSLHLVRLAEIYRRELGELLAEEFDEAGRDPLTARAKLCREYTNLETLLGVVGPEPDAKAPGHKPFRHQLVLLAVEAFRREVISRAKLKEICDLAEVQPGEFNALLATVEQEPETEPKGRRAYVPPA